MDKNLPMFEHDWFIEYVFDWYTEDDSTFKINGINKDTVKAAVHYLETFVDAEICYDTFDRETTRDIMLYWLGHPLKKLEYKERLEIALKKSMKGTWKCS